MTAAEDFARAVAAPMFRCLGEAPRFGGPLADDVARIRARTHLTALFGAEDGAAVVTLLTFFRDWGRRAEYAQYHHHVRNGWKPGPHDRGVVRKAAFVAADLADKTSRSLLAWDAASATTLAAWALDLELVSLAEIAGPLGALLTRTHEAYASWDAFASDLLAGNRFFWGGDAAELAPIVAGLLAGGADGWSSWPAGPVALASPASQPDDDDSSEDDPAPRQPWWVALTLSIDCRGCGAAVHAPALIDTVTCEVCGEAQPLTAATWSYLFTDDIAVLRVDPDARPMIGNDFGDVYFTRRRSEPTAPRCPACHTDLDVEAPLDAAMEVPCRHCSAALRIRPADGLAQAIDRRARRIVELVAVAAPPRATRRRRTAILLELGS